MLTCHILNSSVVAKRIFFVALLYSIVFIVSSSALARDQVSTPLSLKYRVTDIHEHDPQVFTQGLFLEGDILYESSGRYGKSFIRKVKFSTGEELLRKSIPARYFAEGLTICGDKLILLTYRAKKVFIYDKNNFELLKKLRYPREGWGVTCNEQHYIMSDGSNHLYFLGLDDFKLQKRIDVIDDYGPVFFLNELEYVNGYVYSNVWQKNYVIAINPMTGIVEKRFDLEDLASSMSMYKNRIDVLNGIAFNKANGHFLFTGKFWPKLFEIELVPLQ